MTMRVRRLLGRRGAIAVAAVLGVLASAQVAVRMARGPAPPPPHAAGTVRSPAELPRDEVPDPRRGVTTPSPRATTKTQPSPRPSALFGGLGAWVDVYDFEFLDPVESVETMRGKGVRTLWLQTGRYNSKQAVAPEVGPWLVAAHAAGLDVVGWYLPSYAKLDREVRRTVAIARYRYAGERFDGLGIDIEHKEEVRHVPTWNARVAELAARVRREAGSRYPVAAITPTPLGMAVAPWRWAGFPWRSLARSSDALVLMSYWSFRHDCPEQPNHCAYGYTVRNVREARRLSGDRRIPIHVIGGVGDSIDATELADFVRGVRDARADGASLYDFLTTEGVFWDLLAKLRSL